MFNWFKKPETPVQPGSWPPPTVGYWESRAKSAGRLASEMLAERDAARAERDALQAKLNRMTAPLRAANAKRKADALARESV